MFHAVTFRLVGPVQSWSHDEQRRTYMSTGFPTLSGTLGLVCSASGADASRDPAGVDALLVRLMPVATVFRRDVNGEIVEDFQTIGGGQKVLSPETGLQVEYKMPGSVADTMIRRRMTMFGTAFTATLIYRDAQAADDVLDALASPARPLHLGRNSCPPTTPVLEDGSVAGVGPLGVERHELDVPAKAKLPVWAPTMRAVRSIPLLYGADPTQASFQFGGLHAPDRATTLVKDVPLSFGNRATRTGRLMATREVGQITLLLSPPFPSLSGDASTAIARSEAT
jgi:CRISPR system Cascade subunit CasD